MNLIAKISSFINDRATGIMHIVKSGAQPHFLTPGLPVRVRKHRKVPVRVRIAEECVTQALGLVRISKN